MREREGHFLDLVAESADREPVTARSVFTWNHDNANRDIQARSEAQKNAEDGVVIPLFARDHVRLLAEGFLLLRALSVEDLYRVVTWLRYGRLPGCG